MRSKRQFQLGTAIVVLACLGALIGVSPSVQADTSITPDPDPAPYLVHDIRRVTVDNTGPDVGVVVGHRGVDWLGSVTLEIDSGGDPRFDFVAKARRGGAGQFSSGSGGAWHCTERLMSSAVDRRRTTLSLPRTCLAGADHLRVRVTSHSGGSPDDVAVSETTMQQGRPNVVVIMADDMRDDELDGPWLPKTQHLLVDQGVRFVNSFAPLPLCCPARASFLTGQYPHNHKVWTHSDPYGFHAFNDSQTLPVWLSEAGYRTVELGKYLNGYGSQSIYGTPLQRDGSSRSYVPPGWSDWRGSVAGSTYNYWGTHLNNNGVEQDLSRRYQTRAFGGIATRMIDRYSASDRPFFMYLSFTAPHHGLPRDPDDPPVVTDDGENIPKISTPAVPADRRDLWNDDIWSAPGAAGEDDVSDKPSFISDRQPLNQTELDSILEATRQRVEAESVLDDQVARIVNRLRASGELDDTYIMFTSDNGYLLGEHRISQGKILPYEPSLRTPMVIRGPGIPRGQIRTDPFLTIDFAPTVLDIAHGQASPTTNGVPSIDGVSMLGTARSGDHGFDRVVGTETGPKDEDDTAGNSRGVRTNRYLYVEYRDGFTELYDLFVDPGELTNVAGRRAYARDEAALATSLARLDGCAGESCQILLPRRLRSKPADTVGPPAPTWFGFAN